MWGTVRLFEIVFDVEDAPEITPPLPDVEVAILLSELSASSEMDPPDSFDILLNVAVVCVLEDAVERLAPIAIIPPASPVALELLLSTVVALKFNAPVVLMMPPLPFAIAVDESIAEASVGLPRGRLDVPARDGDLHLRRQGGVGDRGPDRQAPGDCDALGSRIGQITGLGQQGHGIVRVDGVAAQGQRYLRI